MRVKNTVILLSGLTLILSLSACKQPEEKTGGNDHKAQVEVPVTAPDKPVKEEPVQIQEPEPDKVPAEPVQGEEVQVPAEELPPVPPADDKAQQQVEPPDQAQAAGEPVQQVTDDKAQAEKPPVQEEPVKEPAQVQESDKTQQAGTPGQVQAGGEEKKQGQGEPPVQQKIDENKLEGKK